MTPDRMRVVLAEWDGHKGEWWCPTCQKWVPPYQVTYFEKHDDSWGGGCGNPVGPSPDYSSDLNAVHELEEKLTREQLVDYCNFRLRHASGEGMVEDYKMITATALQRCEALLRTLNLWEAP